MSKTVTIPISDVHKFVSDGNYVGVAFRYRLVEENGLGFSQWSPVQLLKFKTDYNSNRTINQILGGTSEPTINRSISTFNYTSMENDGSLQSSQIDQITSQISGAHDPSKDSYKFSWTKPKDSVVTNFDVFTSWNMFAYVNSFGTLSAPSAGPSPFTGTLTIQSSGVNSAVSLKSFYDVTGAINDVKIYAGPGGGTPGNSFVITGYGAGNVFNVRSANTWTSGTVKNISRSHAWTDFQYLSTTDTDNYSFVRQMTSNRLSATISSGSCLVYVNENLIQSGVVPGMSLTKLSGDGAFAGNAVISQIDYAENILVISATQSALTTVAASGTIGSVVNNAGIYTATISSMSSTSPLYVGAVVTATAGTGNLGIANVKVTSVSANSITIISDAAVTAGTITAIQTATPNNHTASGYIEFVANSELVGGTFADSGNTIAINQYWLKPMFVQAIATASTADTSNIVDVNNYTVVAVSEAQSTYFDGYGTVGSIAGSGPYTALLTGMNLPYSANLANVGARLYAENTVSGAVPLGASGAVSGETKIADYVNGSKVSLINTTTFTAGIAVSLRV